MQLADQLKSKLKATMTWKYGCSSKI